MNGGGNIPLVIRADASTQIGVGHVMRCLALAQGWKAEGGQVTFITACESASLRQNLLDEGFRVINLQRSYPDPVDLEISLRILATHPTAWVVLDGYHFDPTYQRKIKERSHRLFVIDDMAHLDHYYADVVLNQNINAERLRYACESNTRLLLGTSYVLLRMEFLTRQNWQRKIPDVANKVLVTLGGSDPENQTSKVVKALEQMEVKGLEAVVVIGASNPHFQDLQTTIDNSQLAIRFIRNANNLPELMSWADVGVSAGGSTCWEMAFMGLPSVVMVLAENQRNIAAGLSEAGIVLNLNRSSKVTIDQVANKVTNLIEDYGSRRQMSHLAKELVDGMGVKRVIESLQMESHTISSSD